MAVITSDNKSVENFLNIIVAHLFKIFKGICKSRIFIRSEVGFLSVEMLKINSSP